MTRPLTGSLTETEVVRGVSLRRIGGDPLGGLALISHGGAGDPNSTYLTREEALTLAAALVRAAAVDDRPTPTPLSVMTDAEWEAFVGDCQRTLGRHGFRAHCSGCGRPDCTGDRTCTERLR